MRYELPTNTGLVVNVRHLMGEELRELRRRANEKKFHPMTYALQQCIEIVDPGIYRDLKKFDQLLTGDRLCLYIKIRQKTRGSKYDFQHRCLVQRCRERIDWTIDLRELSVKKLPDAHRKAIVNKNEFSVKVSDCPECDALLKPSMKNKEKEVSEAGKNIMVCPLCEWRGEETEKSRFGEVKVKYSSGYDELQSLEDAAEFDEITATILGQVIAIGDHIGRRAILGLIDKESAALMDGLMDICREYEIGPETNIEIVCKSMRCGAVMMIPMPTDLRFFVDAVGKIS